MRQMVRRMIKGHFDSVNMITKLTETHNYPHKVILRIYKRLGDFVRFVSVIFY